MQALSDAAATQAFGRQLALRLPAGSILLLAGDLGAGKTCLVQGLAAGLGIEEPITSPTFALAQHYPLPKGGGLVHLDQASSFWVEGVAQAELDLPAAGRCAA